MESWNDAVTSERNDLVFEGRNKNYGAFQIRKNYHAALLIALGIGCSIMLLGAGTPMLITLFGSGEGDAPELVNITNVTLTEPPPMEKEPPPPPPPPPPVQLETIAFTVPEVKEEVTEPPPTQEEINKTNVSDKTQDGVKDAPLVDIAEPTKVDEDDNQVFAVVENEAMFPGGNDALNAYLSRNIQYPGYERENNISGLVIIGFVVEKDGSITDVKPLKEVKNGPGLTREAIRVVKNMPKWSPGKMQGRAVRVSCTVPVRFTQK